MPIGTMPSFELDHTAVAVHSINEALKLYRDGLAGEYLMGGDQDTWRWVQLRFPGGGFEFGGTAEGDGKAAEAALPAIGAFLENALR